MARLNFADRYRKANINPPHGLIALRLAALEVARTELTPRRAIELTRIYYGLPEVDSNSRQWLSESFSSTDPSFGMYDNENEVIFLATELLSESFESDLLAAPLAVLTAFVASGRTPEGSAELLVSARNSLKMKSLAAFDPVYEIDDIELEPAPSAPEEDEDSPASLNFVASAVADLASVDEELAEHMNYSFAAVSRRLSRIWEQTEILSWLLGGWSRSFDKPFSSFPGPTLSVLAGLELAQLTSTSPGPIAAPSILYRITSESKKPKQAPASIRKAVDGLSKEELTTLPLAAELNDVPDVCPVLTAFRLAAESAPDSDWQNRFEEVSGIPVDTAFEPHVLAVQCYREALLVAELD